MSVLWLIEKPGDYKSSLAMRLLGEFSLRLFGSIGSFCQLQRLHRSSAPDAIIVHPKGLSSHPLVQIERLIISSLPDTRRIYYGLSHQDKQQLIKACHPGHHILGAATNTLELADQVKTILNTSRKRRLSDAVYRYRDIELDFSKLTLRLLPHRESTLLPLKQAQLLKYFILNPDRCIDRTEIKNQIWQDVAVSLRTIDSHISRLRKHLTWAEAHLESVYGGGYIFS